MALGALGSAQRKIARDVWMRIHDSGCSVHSCTYCNECAIVLMVLPVQVRIVDGFMRHCQADAKWLALLQSLKAPTQEMIAGAIQAQAQWYAQNVDPLLDPTWFTSGPVNVQATTVDPLDESATSDPSTQPQPSVEGVPLVQQVGISGG